MDTIDGMRTFVAVISEGSFSAAAGRLDMSPQLVSKYVGQLEARLGARLLNRSTRRLSITEAGQAYYERCRYILDEIDEMENAVGEATLKAQGLLRINAPMSFGALHLAKAIADYQRVQPHVSVNLTLDDRTVDIVSEGYDMAIRIGRLSESSLIARKLAPVKLVVCAAPGYFRERGTPTSPEDLKSHECLAYAYYSENDRWRFKAKDGTQHEVRIKGRFSANNGDALVAAASAGLGIVISPTFIVAEALRRGQLVEILADFRRAAVPIHAVYPPGRLPPHRVQVITAFLREHSLRITGPTL